jgi:hypothetical protein
MDFSFWAVHGTCFDFFVLFFTLQLEGEAHPWVRHHYLFFLKTTSSFFYEIIVA